MKIFFITPYNIQCTETSEKNDITFCEGFAENGCDVELIFLSRKKLGQEPDLAEDDIFEGYGIQTPFQLNKVGGAFLQSKIGGSRVLYVPVLAAYLFWHSARNMLSRQPLDRTYYISRNSNGLLPVLWAKKLLRPQKGPKIVPWAHELKDDAKYRWLYRNSDGIIGTNSAITDDIAGVHQVPKAKLAESLNPIPEYQLQHILSKERAREQLGLAVDKPLIVYTGKLFIGLKEIAHILEAARQLPDYVFLFTGGRESAVGHYRKYCERHGIKNVVFTGFINRYIQVRQYQFAADVLVSYYTTQDHLVRYNLPNKICEYMLTGNVIVTPDYPATRDILNKSNAFFVEPENPTALAEGLKYVVEHPQTATTLAQNAFQTVQQLTYKTRARILMDFLKSL